MSYSKHISHLFWK